MSKKNQATPATAVASKVEAASTSENANQAQVTDNVSANDTKVSDNDTRTFVVSEIADELVKTSWSFGIGETYVRADGVSVFVRDILAPAVTGSTHTRYIVDVNGMPASYTNTGKSHMINGVATCASPDLKTLLTGKELTITAQSARIGQKYGAKSPLTAVTLEYDNLSGSEQAAFEAYIENIDSDGDYSRFQDRYVGEMTLREYAEQLVEDMIGSMKLPSIIECNIDYDGIARDLSYEMTEADGYLFYDY